MRKRGGEHGKQGKQEEHGCVCVCVCDKPKGGRERTYIRRGAMSLTSFPSMNLRVGNLRIAVGRYSCLRATGLLLT